jgi:NAD(P)H-dependent nitrite reductase small subunit
MSDANQPQTPVAEWTDLCAVADLPPQGGKFVAVKNMALAIFRQNDGVKVMDDTCPHAGGSLSSGFIREGVVYCPWHGWPFRIADGKCPDNENICVRTFEAKVEGDRVKAKI